MLMLEMLANCNWERPLYMAISVGEVSKLKFDHYFVQEGLAFRFTPFDYKKWGNVKGDNNYAIDVERLYENVMNRYKYGGLDTPGLYLDETTLRTCYYHRRLFAQLAKELIRQGDNTRARKVLTYAEQAVPAYNVPEIYESGSFDIAKAYATLGEKTKAMPLLKNLTAESEDYINWAFSLGDNRINMVQRDCLYKFWQWNQYNELVKEIDEEEYRLSNQRFEEKYAFYSLKSWDLETKIRKYKLENNKTIRSMRNALSKINYIILSIGSILIITGYVLMSGEGSTPLPHIILISSADFVYVLHPLFVYSVIC